MRRFAERRCGDVLRRLRNPIPRAGRLRARGLLGGPPFGTPLGSAFGTPFFGRLLRGSLPIVQFFIRRLFTTLPEGVNLVAEHLSSLDLTADDNRFLLGEKARLGAAFHGVSKAEVGAVTSLGILCAGASRFAASNEAHGDRTPPRGDGIVQGEGDGRVGVRHKSILRHYMP